MSAIDEQLASEVDRVAVDVAAGRQAVRSRVRSRRRRRQAGVAVALALVALVGVAVVRSGDDRDQPVVTGPGPTEQSSTTTTSTTVSSTSTAAGIRPVVDVLPRSTDLADGQVVTLRGSGFPTGGHSEVVAYVCDGPGDNDCDASRPSRLLASPDGTVAMRLKVFQEMFGYTGWRRCGACFLRLSWNVGGTVPPPLDLPITFSSAGELAPRPALAISGHDDAAVSIGESITLTGSGFQLDQQVNVGVCVRDNVNSCLFPNWGFTRSDGEGNVRTTGVLDAQFRSRCPLITSCALAVGQQEGMTPAVELPITLLDP